MQTKNDAPLVFFDFAYHYGGSFKSTVLLIGELRQYIDVVVIDVFGDSPEYIQALLKTGVQVFILFPEWRGKTTIGGENAGERVRRLLAFITIFWRIILRLHRKVSKIKPKAIWVNSEKALFTCWLAVPGRVPIVFYVRSELKRIKRYCYFAWKRASMAFGVSEKSLHYLRSTRFAQNRFFVIHNGIDVEYTIVQAKHPPENMPLLGPQDLCIVLPASMGSPLKGHEIAILALARYIDQGGKAGLLFCGDVPPGAPLNTYKKIRDMASSLNLQTRLHFLGWRSDILPILGNSDVILLPSYSEGLPRSILESMALGKPVVATHVGGVPELVRDGIDGFLVEPGNVVGIVEALKRLENPCLRKKMGKLAQSRVREDFSLSIQAQKFLEAIETLL